jgi:4-amino-4-deoxy-L-arabinose transferase-like glycosyltransferase
MAGVFRQGAARFWPVILAGLLIVCATVWLALKIPKGILTYPDELLTAERSREMLIKGRDTVRFNFRHDFAKPPLQYWLTTLTLPKIDNQTTAVRLWPLVYGVLTAVAVGWLAFLVDRQHPWFMPLSVAVYVSCPLFLTEASRALLDTGLTFFATAALAFAQLARRYPPYWLGVAIACWLGALQKIPLIFLIWLVIALVRSSDANEREKLWNRWFVGSAVLGLALVLLWPLFQVARYGMPFMQAFAPDNLDFLFGEHHLGARPYFEVVDGLVASGWAGGSFALVAAMLTIFRDRNSAPRPLVELSIVSVTIVALAVILNFRSVRYVLPIVPCLSLALAFWLARFLGKTRNLRTATIAFLVLLVAGGFIQAEIKMHHHGPDAASEQRVAQELGVAQRSGVRTVLLEPAGKKSDLRSNAFYLFHGNLRFPLQRWTISEFRETPPARPVFGVCVDRDFPVVQTIYPEAKIDIAAGQWIAWQTGASP